MTATDPQTAPVTPPQPRRNHRTIIALAVLTAGIIGGTIAGLAIVSHQAAPPRPAASSPAAASTAPAASAMSTWCAGAGYAAFQAVSGDNTQLQADAGNLAATEADGTRLTADAEAAEALPPPVTRAQKVSYVLAMGAVSFAGTDLSSGDLAAAQRAITAASTYLGQDKGVISCP